jgi:hypothetical protein
MLVTIRRRRSSTVPPVHRAAQIDYFPFGRRPFLQGPVSRDLTRKLKVSEVFLPYIR